MKQISAIIILLFLSFGFGQDTKKLWHEDSLLVWTDFQDEPTIRRVAALSYCGIKFQSCKYRYPDAPTYKITSFFQKDLSWVWEKSKVHYVLIHEQLHFDLAEIYAREMRKYFAENEVEIEDSRSVYKKIYTKYAEMQDVYDDETSHGTNDKEQARWKIKIKDWLTSLDNYKEDKCY